MLKSGVVPTCITHHHAAGHSFRDRLYIVVNCVFRFRPTDRFVLFRDVCFWSVLKKVVLCFLFGLCSGDALKGFRVQGPSFCSGTTVLSKGHDAGSRLQGYADCLDVAIGFGGFHWVLDLETLLSTSSCVGRLYFCIACMWWQEMAVLCLLTVFLVWRPVLSWPLQSDRTSTEL